MPTRKLTIEILGDAKGAAAAFNDAEKSADGFGSKIGGIAKTAGLAVFGIGTAAVGAAAIFGPMVLDMGAELEALGIKSATVFGDSLADVEAWADANAKAMGLTSKQATGLAAGLGDLLKPMGFTSEQAATMSTDVMDLAGALSAWSGGQVDAAGVADIVTSAMLGETDGLKALGIAISASDVEARLAANGASELTGAALEQAKAIAVQQLIMEKSTDAQTAWNNGSMAGIQAQNSMKASLDTVKESLVTALYPALQAIVPVVTDVADWLGARLPGAMAVVKAWVDENWPAIRDAIMVAVDAIREGISGFITFIGDAWAKWGDEIMAVINAVWPPMQTIISGVIETIRGIIQTVTSLIKGDWDGVWNGIKSILSGVWEAIKGIVTLKIAEVKAALSLALEAIALVWGNIWDGIAGKADEIWESIKGFVSEGVDFIVDFVKGIPGKITSAVSGAFEGLKTAFKNAVNWIIDKWNSIDFGIDISVPDWVPGLGGKGFKVDDIFPDIPRLADGGIARARPGGVLALLGEAGHDEAVIPLPRGGMTSGFGGGGNVFNITIQMPPGSDGADVIRKIKDYERANGVGWRLAS
jgi:hypothetical protein